MKAILALLWFLSVLSLPATAAPFQPKMDSLDMGTLDTGRPSKIAIWYPQGECPANTFRLCLADAAVTSKVLLFSHGAMGSADNYSWLGEGLAAAGFIVVGINHYGESRVYGESTQDPRSTAFTWHRAQDVSAALTRLAGEKLFQREVNWNNIVGMGHSEGGQTAAMLAGAQFDLRRIGPYCESADAKMDLGCNYSRNSANAPEQFIALFNAGYQDIRLKKIVLLDPALGSALQQGSLSNIALPSLIIGATHNDFLPWKNHGERYATGIPNAQTILLDGQEGHFVFLTQCQYAVQVMGVPLCEDRPGVDRAAVQRDLLQRIVAFVRVDNEPPSVTRPDSISTESTPSVHSNNFFQILLYTPVWVFALLAALSAFGLMQTRTRRVAVWLALLLPAAMLVLSLTGVLQYVGVWFPALAAWLLGIGTTSMLYLKTMHRETAIYDAESRKLIVAGSWIPMLAILGIFCVRYAMGVAHAMEFEIIHDRNVQLAVSLLLGGFSGFFLARSLLFWRTHASRAVERPSIS